MATPSIDLLLNILPDRPSQILTTLTQHPTLATAADANGYTLLHAAASYAHIDLLRALVTTYNASPNTRDSDGDTPLFYAETVPVARCLIEELGADAHARNSEGETVLERAESEEWILVASYLRERTGVSQPAAGTQQGAIQNGAASDASGSDNVDARANGVRVPPALPENVKIDIGHVSADADGLEAPDPEFRRRIEELAAREDFQGEEGQRQLRELVTDAVRGVAAEQNEGERASRRRVE
ncbi:hypothetical protein EJ05DRAFT_496869 [Pseudovirgaria hyperparasitica]|uniref:Uncharacterized protein n=1 Tax=Pseudovirgaria hyperparasitica TaxID=470096 RepID=A0A6A6WGP8_9PEZI|nr:uncharacterized protein EJ05DRAFT_496869 [Pseudovirgaria hyperparasitica]KAF2761988.1 hypothetical protein EJ05DRAFT_496869 [Pseudovirgaria hyperparasitica]